MQRASREILWQLYEKLKWYYGILTGKHKAAQNKWLQSARPSQIMPPGDWHTWLILAGRGYGKTRTGAETVRMLIEQEGYRHVGLIGQTRDEAHNVMVYGESGLSASCQNRMQWRKGRLQWRKGRLQWQNGAVAQLFSGDHLDKLRGPQFDLVWIDEWAKFRRPEELWNQVQMTLRLGPRPRLIITTTPRPFPFLNKLMDQPGVVVTRGSTFENEQHLAPGFLSQVNSQYAHTSLGAQELYGEILADRDGALWKRSIITHEEPPHTDWKRLVIAIDPATTHHSGSDETGIVMVGLLADGRAYVLEDWSGRHSPAEWGKSVVEAYHRYKVDRVVVETNKGGDLVDRILQTLDPNIAIRHVHATRGKITRAEPAAALYEQGRVKHSRVFRELEQQMCEYTATTSRSPDRMDALVWALTDLLLEREAAPPKVWMWDEA